VTETIIYQGKKVALVTRQEVLPDGTAHPLVILRHPGAAVLLPWVDSRMLCMVRVRRRAVAQTLLELPAGTLDPDETPEACAARELQEETGYSAGNLELLRVFYPSPGILTERMYLYAATDLAPGPQRLDAGEQLQAELVPFDQALQWVLDGTIIDAKTMIGILLWDRLRRP
jgi:ADP-ribose pyrophosphatase